MAENYPIYKTTFIDDMRSLVEEAAANFPERIAVSYRRNAYDKDAIRVSFPDWRNDIRGLGTSFLSKGLREKRIAVIGENSYEWCCTYFATMAIGSVLVPVDKELPGEDITHILNFSECDAIVVGKSSVSKIESIKDSLETVKQFFYAPDQVQEMIKEGEKLYEGGDNSYYDYKIDIHSLAQIVFTSGTTGKGKGVMLSQANICQDMTYGMYLFQLYEKSVFVLPPHHTFGSTVNFIGHLAQGCEIYISSGLRHVGEEMQSEQPTQMILVPAFLESMNKKIWETARKTRKTKLLKALISTSNTLRKLGIDERRKLFSGILSSFGGKLHTIICGGAKLDESVISTFDAIGITVMNGYGITECSPLISANRNKWQKPGSVGTPILGCRVKISNPDEYGDGEICVKGPNVMLGYFKNPEATAEAFDKDGYFKTGDYGHLDEDGWIYITGRLKNLIILSNGKNVYPEEIEAELVKIPGVNEVVVYAAESKNLGNKELIVAEIFPDNDLLSSMGIENKQKYFEEEIAKTNATMPPYKAVKMVRLRDVEFPKNTSRKIVRFKIDKNID